MVSWILKKILGSKNQREIKRLKPLAVRINEFDEQFKTLSDDALRAKTAEWKAQLAAIPDLPDQWTKLEEILPEAFAVVKNAARRLTERQHTFDVCDQPMTWNMVHFDVQLVNDTRGALKTFSAVQAEVLLLLIKCMISLTSTDVVLDNLAKSGQRNARPR
jgi:preprotein translocase subunit SecA